MTTRRENPLKETYTPPEEVVFEARVAFVDLPLIVTVEQLANARDTKSYIIVKMPCMDFLRLTTQNDEHLEDILDDSPEDPDIFNVYSLTGNSRMMPTLGICLLKDLVTGHEGRHRMGSVINAVGKKDAFAYVSIDLDPSPKDLLKYGRHVGYDLSVDDIPEVVEVQTFSLAQAYAYVKTDKWKTVIPDLSAMMRFLEQFETKR